MIKLFALYNFHDVHGGPEGKVHGIWETFEVHNLNTSKTRWKLRRVATFDNNHPIGKEIEFPEIIFKLFGYKVNRQALNGVWEGEKLNG